MKINGVVASAYGFYLAEPPGWLDAPTIQTPTATVPGRGTLATAASTPQPRKVLLRGHVRGKTAAIARTNLDLLKLALSDDVVELTFDDQATRFYRTRRESFVTPPLSQGAFLTKDLRVEITMTALDPYNYDVTATSLATAGPMPLGTAPIRPVLTFASITAASPPWFIDMKDFTDTVVQTMTINSACAAALVVVDNDTQVITEAGLTILDKLSGDFFKIDPLVHADYAAADWPYFVTRNVGSGGVPVVSYRRAWL